MSYSAKVGLRRKSQCSSGVSRPTRPYAHRPSEATRITAMTVDARVAAMARVLFVCLQNAGRSQMSRGLFERSAGSRHEARSAGTQPAARVQPEVVGVMDEIG